MKFDIDWKAIQAACDALLVSNVKKIEGDKYTVYKVGMILRIDIKE